MQLCFNQISAITTGAVSIEQEETGIRFYRFNREQRALRQPRVQLRQRNPKMAGTLPCMRCVEHHGRAYREARCARKG